MLLIVLLVILFSCAFILAKDVLTYVEPLFLMSFRLTIAGILLLSYYVIRHGKNIKNIYIKKKDWWLFAQAAFFGIYLFAYLDLWSLQYLTSAKSAFLFNLTPFFSALFSYIYFSEIMTPKKWWTLTFGVAGFLPILMLNGVNEDLFGRFFFISVPELANFFAIICYAYGCVVVRKLVRDHVYHPSLISGLSMFLSGIASIPASYIIEGWLPITNLNKFLTLSIALIFVSNIGVYYLYATLLKTYTATFLSLAILTSSFLTAFLGWLLLGETVSYAFFISAAIVPIALYFFYKEEVRQGYIKRGAK